MLHLKNQYFDWLCQIVCDQATESDYRLLNILNQIDFTYIMNMDENRASDGISLRYRFGYEKNIDDKVIMMYLDGWPCSVLEMMIALAIRCEEHIMSDSEIGDRTRLWFWEMIKSLGLTDFKHFDENQIKSRVFKFLNREYDADGTGGLFTVPECRYDLRTADIWYQMMWYLCKKFKT